MSHLEELVRKREVSVNKARGLLGLPPVKDEVNHPGHYTSGSIEVWDFIVDQKLDYIRGNVIKYVTRAGKKYPEKEVQDLEKARAYLDKAIKMVEENNAASDASDLPAQSGVWAIVNFNDTEYIEMVFNSEIEALREVNRRGYGTVTFIDFGKSLIDMKTQS